MKWAGGLPIGALSKRSGVNIETIRYYEKIGVMPAPARSAGGYRIYGPGHLKRLRFVRRGRELGFSLDELRGLLRLVDRRAYTCAEVHRLTSEHLAEIRRKIRGLRRLERVMADMAAQCTRDRIPDCPIIDALFDVRPISGGGRGGQSQPSSAGNPLGIHPGDSRRGVRGEGREHLPGGLSTGGHGNSAVRRACRNGAS